MSTVVACDEWEFGEDEEGEGRLDPDTACVNGERWTGGNEESPLMRPGHACIFCHRTDPEAEPLAVAGTVYGRVAEPDDCVGLDGYMVEVTDADGVVHSMTSNRAGNFFIEHGTISTPYTARIIEPDGTERRMVTPQTVTDCNSCHTVEGANAAAGRL